MTSRQAATKSAKRDGETKYSCRMSVRKGLRSSSVMTGSFIRLLRVDCADIDGLTTASVHQRRCLAVSQPSCARKISRETWLMKPEPEAGGIFVWSAVAR